MKIIFRLTRTSFYYKLLIFLVGSMTIAINKTFMLCIIFTIVILSISYYFYTCYLIFLKVINLECFS